MNLLYYLISCLNRLSVGSNIWAGHDLIGQHVYAAEYSGEVDLNLGVGVGVGV